MIDNKKLILFNQFKLHNLEKANEIEDFFKENLHKLKLDLLTLKEFSRDIEHIEVISILTAARRN